MEEKKQGFQCTGDCLRCSVLQRQYCAAQFTYNSVRMLEDQSAAIAALQNTVDNLKTKLDAIQGNEALVFKPMAEPSGVSAVASPVEVAE